MGVAVKYRPNKDGSITPLLDIYYKGTRCYEFLWFLKLSSPLTKHDRAANKERMIIIKTIQANIAIHLTCMEYAIEYGGLKYKPKIKLAFPTFPAQLVEKYPELISLNHLLKQIKKNLKTKENDNKRQLLNRYA